MNDKKPGDDVIEDMSLEDTAEEKEEKQKDAEKIASDMPLDDSVQPGPEDFKARIEKLFPSGEYTYIAPDAPLVKLPEGGYSLRGVALADLTDEWKKKLDDFLKEKEKK